MGLRTIGRVGAERLWIGLVRVWLEVVNSVCRRERTRPFPQKLSLLALFSFLGEGSLVIRGQSFWLRAEERPLFPFHHHWTELHEEPEALNGG